MARKLRKSQDKKGKLEIPHDPVNEQILIAAAAIEPGIRHSLVRRVKPDLFQTPGHAAIWECIREMDQKGLDFDRATMNQLSGGEADGDYVEELCMDRPEPPPNINHHVAVLEWDYARIDAARGPLSELLHGLKDTATKPERIKALAKSVARSFGDHSGDTYLRDPNELIRETMKGLRERRNGLAVYPFGVESLDLDLDTGKHRLIPGAAPGKITCVTGVPGSGKSTFVNRLILGQYHLKRQTLVGAWEMGDSTTLEILAVMELGWSRYMVSTGTFTEEQEAQLQATMEKISQYVRFVQMPFGKSRGERVNNDAALDRIHQYIQDSGAQVAFFDLWKRCLRQIDPNDEEQALIRQQAIAEETACHCVLVQQQRAKSIEKREDPRPTREGIKGSGAWIEVPDNILGVHRPALWSSTDDVTLEIDVLKQRYGVWPIAVEFDWHADRGEISDGRTVPYDRVDDIEGSNDFAAFAGGKGKKKN